MSGPATAPAVDGRASKGARSHSLAVDRIARRLARRAARGLPRRGLLWYRVEAQWIGREAERAGIPFHVAAAVAAALSPATAWGPLRERFPAFIDAAMAGDRRPAFPTYGAQRVLAAAVARGELPASAVGGPKVGPFARALAGDPSAVVVDRHQARICGLPDVPTARQRRAAVAAHVRVARAFGVAPRDLQAALWVQRVGASGDAGGRLRKAGAR